MKQQIFIDELQGNFYLRTPKENKPTLLHYVILCDGKKYRNGIKTGFGRCASRRTRKRHDRNKPDTIYVPVPMYAEKEGHDRQTQAIAENRNVSIETVEPGQECDEAINAALIDWNTKRSYSGTFFDNKTDGKFTYSFDMQFNKAGQINYKFELVPVPVLKP